MKQFQDLNRVFRSHASRISTDRKQASVGSYRVGELLLSRTPPLAGGRAARSRRGSIRADALSARRLRQFGSRRAAGRGRVCIDCRSAGHCAGVSAWRRGGVERCSVFLAPSGNQVEDRPAARSGRRGSSPVVDLAGWCGRRHHTCAARDDVVTDLHFRAPSSDSRQAMGTFDSKECILAISRLHLKHSSVVERLSLASARTRGNE